MGQRLDNIPFLFRRPVVFAIAVVSFSCLKFPIFAKLLQLDSRMRRPHTKLKRRLESRKTTNCEVTSQKNSEQNNDGRDGEERNPGLQKSAEAVETNARLWKTASRDKKVLTSICRQFFGQSLRVAQAFMTALAKSNTNSEFTRTKPIAASVNQVKSSNVDLSVTDKILTATECT